MDLLVAVSLSLDLPQDVDSVVVAECPAHLVIVHAQMIFLNAPEPGQAGWINNLEDSGLLVLPLDVWGVSLAGIVQQLLQKVPEEPPVGGGRLRLSLRPIPGGAGWQVGGGARRGGGCWSGGTTWWPLRVLHWIFTITVRRAIGSACRNVVSQSPRVGGDWWLTWCQILWYLEVWRDVEGRHGRGPLLLRGAAVDTVHRGGGGQGHRVGLRDQVGQVGEGLGGGAVQQGPVAAEWWGGGRRHQPRGPRGEGAGGSEAAGLPEQHLQDVVDHIPRPWAPLCQVIFREKTQGFTWTEFTIIIKKSQRLQILPFIWNLSMSIFSRSNSFSQYWRNCPTSSLPQVLGSFGRPPRREDM